MNRIYVKYVYNGDKMYRAATLLLLTAIFGTGLAMLFTRGLAPRGSLEILVPTPMPAAPIAVYVTGAVAREGVYTLLAGDLVERAVQAADGLAPDADKEQVNLAARLKDQQHIHVARLGEAVAAPQPGKGTPQRTELNINIASVQELDGLPGIGPTRAQAIVEYRTANGPFKRTDDLMKVRGIGPSVFDGLKDLVTVE